MSEELISETLEDEAVDFDEGEELVSDRIADLVEYLVVNIVDDADGVSLEVIDGASSVSYTHLDVYKRQVVDQL